MMIEAFATEVDLVQFRGGSNELPANASVLLARASEIIWSLIRFSYNSQNDAHVLAACMATCAQASYWINTGTLPDDESSIDGYTLGDLSVTGISRSAANNRQMLCPLSMTYLRNEGLLYRGIVRG